MAVSDEAGLFSFPLSTVETQNLSQEVEKVVSERQVKSMVMGMPVNLKGEATQGTEKARQIFVLLRKKFPSLPIFQVDERFSSSMARQAMLMGGMKKKDRQEKENVDKLSATIILQSFLDQVARFGWPQVESENPKPF